MFQASHSVCLAAITGRAFARFMLGAVSAATLIGCTPAAVPPGAEEKSSAVEHRRTAEILPNDEQQEERDEMPAADPVRAAPSPVVRPEEVKRVAHVFADLLLAGNYEGAYMLTSGRLRHRMPLSQFAQLCRGAAEKYGDPIRLGSVVVDRTAGLAGEHASGQYGFPVDIPDGDRLAWVHCALALDVDGEEILRCYDCWMLVENDGGKAHIGHFAFTACE